MNGFNWYLRLLVFVAITIVFQGELPTHGQEPRTRELPEGRLGEIIRLGEAIVEKTTSHPLSQPLVGNALNCTSCHLKNGTHPRRTRR